MSESISHIVENIEMEASNLRTDKSIWKRLMDRHRKRTHFRFRYRVLIAAAILLLILTGYVLLFIHGNPLGDRLNDWTDTIVAPIFTWIMTTIGNLMGRDWSDMGDTFARLSTFGPLSFIVVAAVISFVIAGIIAFIYSQGATKHSRDDGTPNFLAEKPRKA